MNSKYSYKIFQILLNSPKLDYKIKVYSGRDKNYFELRRIQQKSILVECGSNLIWNLDLQNSICRMLLVQYLNRFRENFDINIGIWHWSIVVGNICSVCIFIWQERWISCINQLLFSILYSILSIFYLRSVWISLHWYLFGILSFVRIFIMVKAATFICSLSLFCMQCIVIMLHPYNL